MHNLKQWIRNRGLKLEVKATLENRNGSSVGARS